MIKPSAFVGDTSHARLIGEEKYHIAFAALLFVCGFLFFAIPAFDKNGLFILAEGWTLLAVLGLCLLRPVLYSRGMADFMAAIMIGTFYGFLGYILGMNAHSIEKYWLGICIALFLAGLSRIFAFARLTVVVNLPLLLICAFAEITAAILLFIGWPGNDSATIYWLIGMTVILSGFESLAEAAKLRALC